jgi:hypothetical protein
MLMVFTLFLINSLSLSGFSSAPNPAEDRPSHRRLPLSIQSKPIWLVLGGSNEGNQIIVTTQLSQQHPLSDANGFLAEAKRSAMEGSNLRCVSV